MNHSLKLTALVKLELCRCSILLRSVSLVTLSITAGWNLEASVVVTTPAEPITLSTMGVPFAFDLNNDGVDDLAFSGTLRLIDVTPIGAARVMIDDQAGIPFASDLADDSFIGVDPGAGMIWQNGQIALSGCSSGAGLVCQGNFLGGFDFLAVEFEISGATHYGWIEIESRTFIGHATFHRWAYEDEAGKGILAGAIPEPSVPVLLFAFFGIFVLRRQRLRDS
jgi:hypothetical protein